MHDDGKKGHAEMGHTIMMPRLSNTLATLLLVLCATAAGRACRASEANRLELLPYPQEVEPLGGRLPLGPPDCKTAVAPSTTEHVAVRSLAGYLPKQGKAVTIRLGSVEEGYDHRWLASEERTFLASAND